MFLISLIDLPKIRFSERLFFAVYPVMIADLISRFAAFYLIQPFFMIDNTSLNNNAFFLLLSYILVMPIYVIVHKILDIPYGSFTRLIFNKGISSTKRWLFWLGMLSYIVMIYFFQYANLLFNFPLDLQIDIRKTLVLLYAMLLLGILSVMNRYAKRLLEMKASRSYRRYLDNLEGYNHHIEDLYVEIDQFKQGYEETLTGLKDDIDSGDLERIRNSYEEVIGRDEHYLKENPKFELVSLVNIKSSAIKSLLSAKMVEMHKLGIKTYLELPDKIDHIHLPELDFLIILSVFLDNAIEESKSLDDAYVRIALLEDQGNQILVIENPTQAEQVDIRSIFQRGYSSKSQGRGIGLANVRDILENYPAVSLSTKSTKHRFSQTLVIREK
ncbi:GHKL domain-containing protein [Streptococcus loxodontisalivarius]|uniref:Two-component system sensor histidine kinase AgrC n=1 Tax=Streptococcus loxodontisalivarius TaxID=1349415 RepID=A0ABS2PS32_9STRE|nr:GHKL domain-containing protein [Streptococcus loxodontisalivarius]MBM7642849.1 two-component system sensor histidine kinase AgrC [Streptococcus loxodontisalivarius]